MNIWKTISIKDFSLPCKRRNVSYNIYLCISSYNMVNGLVEWTDPQFKKWDYISKWSVCNIVCGYCKNINDICAYFPIMYFTYIWVCSVFRHSNVLTVYCSDDPLFQKSPLPFHPNIRNWNVYEVFAIDMSEPVSEVHCAVRYLRYLKWHLSTMILYLLK